MRNKIIDLLGGSAYNYSEGNTTFTTPNLEGYTHLSIIIKVSGVSGTGSTFTFTESLDKDIYAEVKHSELTAGAVTIDSAEVVINMDYSPFIKKYIKINFNNNSETGTIDAILVMPKA